RLTANAIAQCLCMQVPPHVKVEASRLPQCMVAAVIVYAARVGKAGMGRTREKIPVPWAKIYYTGVFNSTAFGVGERGVSGHAPR
ncbi:MAG: hypothetical protein ACREJ8_07295, partial [Candidatus Methylomirabilales bacterium]